MRRDWDPEDLIAFWTLLDSDWQLVANKSGATRLGFVSLLKFFEIEGRFPQYTAEVPEQAVVYLAEQVKVDMKLFAKYEWSGRTIEYHRAQIRAALGFQECSESDQDELAGWLAREVCPNEQRREPLRDAVLAQCRVLRMEPPTFGQISLLVGSALTMFEQRFCTTIAQRLDAAGVGGHLELLYQPSPDAAGGGETFLSELKAGPGPLGVDTFLAEVGKLRRVRALGLPAALFEGWSERLVDDWRTCWWTRSTRSTLRQLVAEAKANKRAFNATVRTALRSSYSHYYRRVLPDLLAALEFRSGNDYWRPIILALALLARYKDIDVSNQPQFAVADVVPLDGGEFVDDLKRRLDAALTMFNDALAAGNTGGVKVTTRRGEPWLSIPNMDKAPQPANLEALKAEVQRRWGTIDLLDVLKEADYLTGFTEQFASVFTREALPAPVLRRRRLLVLFALGTNVGIKRIADGLAIDSVGTGDTEAALRRVRASHITRDNLRTAIRTLVNATLAMRDPAWWGAGTGTTRGTPLRNTPDLDRRCRYRCSAARSSYGTPAITHRRINQRYPRSSTVDVRYITFYSLS